MEAEAPPVQENAPAEFDPDDRRHSKAVNQSIAFSGRTVDFFTRVKADYFIDLIESLRPPAARAEVIDIGCGVAHAHPLLADSIVHPTAITTAADFLASVANIPSYRLSDVATVRRWGALSRTR